MHPSTGNCDESRAGNWCERLYQTKAAGLILYGRALGLSHDEAEDVVQDVFTALLKISTPPEDSERYVIRSFRNRALNYRRGFWRRLARELESRRWFEPATDEGPAERAAMRCLARLPKQQRETIVLKIWHHYTFEEIGELLATSPNTISARYRYGLQKIRTCLKGKNHEQFDSLGESIALLDSASAIRKA